MKAVALSLLLFIAVTSALSSAAESKLQGHWHGFGNSYGADCGCKNITIPVPPISTPAPNTTCRCVQQVEWDNMTAQMMSDEMDIATL